MAQFETHDAHYTITDAAGRWVALTAQEADALLQWLYDVRDTLAEQTRTWQDSSYTPPQALRDLLDEQQAP